MVKWKDFLYFSKNDRVGILLLLLLISIAGIFLIYLNNFSEIDPAYLKQSEELQKDFTYFEEDMTDIQPITEENETSAGDIPESKKKASKTKQTKLSEGQTIDINSVSKETFTRIPGIGETFAERIVEYRNQLGGFANLDQMTDIKGITTNKFSTILPYIIIQKKHKQIRINKASESELSKHPYLNEDQITEIIDLRKQKKITSIEDLPQTVNFTARDVEKLSPYLSFE